MTDLNVNFDDMDKTISLGSENIKDTGIQLSTSNVEKDDLMLGVELLANQPIDKQSDKGYSSGDDNISVPKTPKESYDFFEKPSDDNHKTDEKKNINLMENDPIINNARETQTSEFKAIHEMNGQEIKNEKIDLIYKFKKLEGQGIRTTMNYNMNSQLDDMRNEYLKLKKQREVDNSVKFQRKIMMAAITGLEFLNNKFDPFDVKLDGWSESVNENIYDYDEVFEELAEKYGGATGDVPPEIKLIMMVGGSAFMFHLTNTMFKSSIPGMDDIMKQNPDLMKQFAKAAVSSIGKTGGSDEPPPTRRQSEPSSRDINMGGRPDMNGPSGIDDIINQMNLQPSGIPDLDTISIVSGDTDKLSQSSKGITLNL